MDDLAVEFTYVSTAEDLQRALLDGARDVLIQEHLVLTGTPPLSASVCDECTAHLGSVLPQTRTIRVRIYVLTVVWVLSSQCSGRSTSIGGRIGAGRWAV